MFDKELSIIIRNKNEAKHIKLALESVLKFFPNAEVIIMDNNSDDNSMEIINSFSNKIQLRSFDINDYTPGKSINFAVSKINREYILILSAHCELLHIDYKVIIEELESHFALFGEQIPYKNYNKINATNIWTHFSDRREINMYSKIENRYFLHNAFCFYKTATLKYLPFDEILKGKEDRFWAKSIIEKGKSYVYNPLLKCNHYFTEKGATWKDT